MYSQYASSEAVYEPVPPGEDEAHAQTGPPNDHPQSHSAQSGGNRNDSRQSNSNNNTQWNQNNRGYSQDRGYQQTRNNWNRPPQGQNRQNFNPQANNDLIGEITKTVGKYLGGILPKFSLKNLDNGDILLILIILFLYREGDNLDIVIALGLFLLLGLGEDGKEEKKNHSESEHHQPPSD